MPEMADIGIHYHHTEQGLPMDLSVHQSSMTCLYHLREKPTDSLCFCITIFLVVYRKKNKNESQR